MIDILSFILILAIPVSAILAIRWAVHNPERVGELVEKAEHKIRELVKK